MAPGGRWRSGGAPFPPPSRHLVSQFEEKPLVPSRLIATGKHRNLEKTARGAQPAPAWNNPLTAAMAARLATPDGITAYRQRGHIAETPHGNIKHNMGFRQLTLRGQARAAAE